MFHIVPCINLRPISLSALKQIPRAWYAIRYEKCNVIINTHCFIFLKFTLYMYSHVHNYIPSVWDAGSIMSVSVSFFVTCVILQITFTNGYNLNHISRLITALMPRSGFALESPWRGWAQVRFFSGPIDTELITMLFANMTIQMLKCYDILSKLYLRLDNFQGFLVLWIWF